MSGLLLVSHIMLWVLFLAVAVVLVSVLRNLGIIAEAIRVGQPLQVMSTKLRVGDVVPNITLQTCNGQPTFVHELAGRSTALIVVSPHCGSCHTLLEHIAAKRDGTDPLDLGVEQTAIISVGNFDEAINFVKRIGKHTSLPLFVDIEEETEVGWDVLTTPTILVMNNELQLERQHVGFSISSKAVVHT